MPNKSHQRSSLSFYSPEYERQSKLKNIPGTFTMTRVVQSSLCFRERIIKRKVIHAIQKELKEAQQLLAQLRIK